MSAKVKELEKAFAAAEREHTAAAEHTRVLANKRADLWRQLKAAREEQVTEEPTTNEVEQ